LCVTDYNDDSDAFLVPTQPVSAKAWNDFFHLDIFRHARVHHLLARADVAARLILRPADVGSGTLSVLEQMARLGVHRVPIISRSGVVLGLVTQSMFISFISQQMSVRLGRLKETRVCEFLASLTGKAFTVTDSTLAINAFKLMAHLGVAALGVVNREGVLVGTISATDLSGMGCNAKHFERLWHPMSLFLLERIPSNSKPATVFVMDTLETVINKMDDGNVHIVFVVGQQIDQQLVPLHAITQRDVLRVVCNLMGLAPM
jgi:CBS-domain-containing membrane protein